MGHLGRECRPLSQAPLVIAVTTTFHRGAREMIERISRFPDRPEATFQRPTGTLTPLVVEVIY